MGFFVTCAWSLFPRPPITQVGRRGYPGSNPLTVKSLLPCPHYWLMTEYERWSWRKSWILCFRPFWHRSLVSAMRHFQITAAPVHLPRCCISVLKVILGLGNETLRLFSVVSTTYPAIFFSWPIDVSLSEAGTTVRFWTVYYFLWWANSSLHG